MAKANTARVARIVAAGEAFCGEGWQSAMARSIGISKQLLSFIISGVRRVHGRRRRRRPSRCA